MAKRFIDTELDDKAWFNELPCRIKCAVQYIFRKCDNVGVWDPNYKIAAAYIGEGGFTEAEILKIDTGRQFEKLENGKIFVVGFCDFQYGKLEEHVKPHRAYIQKLKKYGLYERVCKGYAKGIYTLQEKEEETEIEEEGIKEEGTGETIKGLPIVPAMMERFKESNPEYLVDQEVDYPSLRLIAQKIHKWLGLNWLYDDPKNAEDIKLRWGEVVDLVRSDTHYCTYSLTRLNKHFQSITQSFSNGRAKANKSDSPVKLGTSEARTAAAKEWGLSAGEQVSGVD